MTRINLVAPSTLHTKHLVAEYRELPRAFSLARKAQYILHTKHIPKEYVLGTGHVTFFYDKLLFLIKRYTLLCAEMSIRGFNFNPISLSDLLDGIDKRLLNDYVPTIDAIALNVQRIKDRTKKEWS